MDFGVVSSGLSDTIQRRRGYHAALFLSLAFSLSALVNAIVVAAGASVESTTTRLPYLSLFSKRSLMQMYAGN